jgi:hypothetical protein
MNLNFGKYIILKLTRLKCLSYLNLNIFTGVHPVNINNFFIDMLIKCSSIDIMERNKTGSPDHKSSVNINYEAYIIATNEYRLAKLKYYREVLRKNDQELINSLNKIPDDWGKYETGSSKKLIIESSVKKRLSDIKEKKSWELKYESLFLSHIVIVEESLIDCLSFNNISDERLSESIESLNCIMVEIGSQTFNIKHLLMSLAKRSVSDLYYLMSAYYQFFKKKPFDVDINFYEFCEDILVLFNDHKRIYGTISLIKDIMEMINPYFSVTAFSAGWRLDEFAMKQFAEKNDADKKQMANNMKKAVQLLHSLKMKMKRARDFLSYYYSPRDGKMYRYNFIVESLARKLDEGKITSHDFDSFNNIKYRF